MHRLKLLFLVAGVLYDQALDPPAKFFLLNPRLFFYFKGYYIFMKTSKK